MSFERDRHEAWEVLISASLAGDISEVERRQLDAHLDSCAACRSTLAAFADQRRIMSGLRHVPPPRDLGARVRAGIERSQRRAVPWWKRPPAIFGGVGGGLAVVAGALLAFVLLDDGSRNAPVGQLSPTPVVSSAAPASVEPSSAPASRAVASMAAAPTLPPPQSPLPSGAEPTPVPTDEAPAESLPATTASPEPDGYLAVTGPIESPEVTVRDAENDEPVIMLAQPAEEPVAAAAMVPVAAELSPGGDWLAFVAEVGESGTHEIRATRIGGALDDETQDGATTEPQPIESSVEVGTTLTIGSTVADSPFLEVMSWSSDGRFLAVTLADPATPEPDADVWIFDAADGAVHRLTDTGTAFAGSFVPSTDGSAQLWVSIAADEPRSWTITLPTDAPIETVDPTQDGAHEVQAFQPLVAPNGAFVIFWSGRMAPMEGGWRMSEGGQPMLAEHQPEDPAVFPAARPLFGDLVVDRDGFSDAAIVWSPNSDAYAVWNARWTGVTQGEGDYPHANRVYFGRATDPRGLTRVHAIDAGDIPADSTVVDVKLSPTGRHLAVTARRPRGGVLDPAAADLILVTRNTGEVPDEIDTLASGDDGWFGPAVFDDTAWDALTDE